MAEKNKSFDLAEKNKRFHSAEKWLAYLLYGSVITKNFHKFQTSKTTVRAPEKWMW